MSELAEYVEQARERFVSIAPNMEYESEKGFALQLLENNQMLGNAAKQNPKSLMHSMRNVAAIGLSLNPAKRQAYLINRTIKKRDPQSNRDVFMPTVCLEPSYIGLCDLATQSGCIEWIQAKEVRENDTYENQGPGQKPLHKYNSFKDRGEIIGFYCVAKTTGGDYLTEEMDKSQIDSVMERSESVKYARKNNKPIFGPWASDYEEMAKKTVVRRAFKMWPKSPAMDRLSQAVHISNDNEGFEPLESEPNTQSANADQKNFFDGLIEKDDALGMYVFRSTIEESVFISLYHSFPRGIKGKNQQIIDGLLKRGQASYQETETQVLEAVDNADIFALQEALADCDQPMEEMMVKNMNSEMYMAFTEMKKEIRL